jgi:hypothetical protein
MGKGHSSRYFYNEVPNPQVHRHGGHLDNIESELYSFTKGDQPSTDNIFGLDMNTPQGKTKFTEIMEWWDKVAPETYSHQINEYKQEINQEPHFQRVWHHYREFLFSERVNQAIRKGDLS